MPSSINQDTENSDLYWVIFEVASWQEFVLITEDLKTFISEQEHPIYLVFDARSDMPKGNPLVHIKSWLNYVAREPKVLQLILLLHSTQPIAKVFIDVALRVFQRDKITLVHSRDEVHTAYHKLASRKSR
jgi:hypothetical protein